MSKAESLVSELLDEAVGDLQYWKMIRNNARRDAKGRFKTKLKLILKDLSDKDLRVISGYELMNSDELLLMPSAVDELSPKVRKRLHAYAAMREKESSRLRQYAVKGYRSRERDVEEL